MPLTQEQEFEFRLRQEREQQTLSPDVLTTPGSVPSHLLTPDPLTAAAAAQFGVPPQNVDLDTGLGPGHRLGAGAAGDTPEERLKYYQKYGPPGHDWALVSSPDGEQYVAGRNSQGGVIFPNPPGFDVGDVTQASANEALPTLLGGAGVAVGGPAALALGALGYGAGRVTQEVGQRIAGTQGENLGDVGTRVGTEMLFEAGPQAVLGGAQKASQLARGLVFKETPPPVVDDLARIKGAREDLGMNLGPLYPPQVTDQPVMQAGWAQTERLLGTGVGRQAEQMTGAVEDLPRIAEAEALGLGGATRVLEDAAQRKFDQVYGDLPPVRSLEDTGATMTSGFKTAYKKSESDIKSKYRKVDAAQARENPIFDIDAAKKKAANLGVFGVGEAVEEIASAIGGLDGKPIDVTTVNKLVNVGSPQGAVARVTALLGQLAPEQVDYRVLQRMRSVVGHTLKSWGPGNDNFNVGQAKQLYGVLTDALLKPKNADEATGYVDAFKTATAAAKDQINWLQKDRVKQIMRKSDDPVALGKSLANNPSVMTQDVRGVIDQYAPGKASLVKQDVLARILNPRNTGGTMVGRLEKLAEDDPGVLQWLAGSQPQVNNLTKQAAAFDTFKSGAFQEVLKRRDQQIETGVSTLRDVAVGPKSSRDFVTRLREADPKKGAKAARRFALEALTDGIVQKDPEIGVNKVDYKKYLSNVEKAKTAGWYDNILTADDRKRVDAMEAYLRRTKERTHLAQMATGGQGGKLNKLSGLKDLAMEVFGARYVGFILSNPKMGDLMMDKAISRQRAKGTRAGQGLGFALGAIANAVNEDVNLFDLGATETAAAP